MNKIDEAISKWGMPNERIRVQGLVLFDYYLTRYNQVVRKNFSDIKHVGMGRKAMTNFFFICLNSVSEDSYGLFEICTRFGMVCGWQYRLVSATYVDAERLGNMMPSFQMLNGLWVERAEKHRHRIWSTLGNESTTELIGTSSLAKYAKMIDDGIEDIIEKLPASRLVEFKNNGPEQKIWIDWLTFTTETNFVQHVLRGFNRHSYDIHKVMSIRELLADKECLRQNL